MRTDEIIDSYLMRNAHADKMYRTEAQYSMQMKWMRRMLSIIELAMEDEGVPESTQIRVLRTAIYGTAEDPSDAQARADWMIAAAQGLADLKSDPRVMQLYEGNWTNMED